MTPRPGPTFDPGDDRRITREQYQDGRRMARLLAHLRPSPSDHQRRWDELVHRLACSHDAKPEEVAKLQEKALEAGKCTTVSSLEYLSAMGARYFNGDRFCAVCDQLAPLRDEECPDCCH